MATKVKGIYDLATKIGRTTCQGKKKRGRGGKSKGSRARRRQVVEERVREADSSVVQYFKD